MKKKIIFLLIIVLVLILIFIFIFNLKSKKNIIHSNLNYTKIILPDKNTNDVQLLFYESHVNYYIQGYNIQDIYVLINSKKEITEDIIELAKENINLGNKTFQDSENNYYELFNLREALYLHRLPITVLEKHIELIKEEVKLNFGNITIEEINDSKDYNVLRKEELSTIFLKNLKISGVIINDESYNDINKINNYTNDIFIDHLLSIGKIESIEFSDDFYKKIKLNINNLDIYIGIKVDNNMVEYYIWK